jgi:HK97 family phage prohead protease
VFLTKSATPDEVTLGGEAGEDSRRATFTISSSAPDRESDTISVAGWSTDNYKRNPVVLWGHDQSALPVGRVTNLFSDGNTLKAEVEFATADVNPVAEMVYQGVKKGFIKATSVGFQPIEWQINEERQKSGSVPPVDFTKTELLELSIVNVPANAEALLEPDLIVISESPKNIDITVAKNKRARAIAILDLKK